GCDGRTQGYDEQREHLEKLQAATSARICWKRQLATGDLRMQSRSSAALNTGIHRNTALNGGDRGRLEVGAAPPAPRHFSFKRLCRDSRLPLRVLKTLSASGWFGITLSTSWRSSASLNLRMSCETPRISDPRKSRSRLPTSFAR